MSVGETDIFGIAEFVNEEEFSIFFYRQIIAINYYLDELSSLYQEENFDSSREKFLWGKVHEVEDYCKKIWEEFHRKKNAKL